MITNFEIITAKLSFDDMQFMPVLIAGFRTHGKDNPIKEPEILAGVNSNLERNGLKKKLTGARLRKCCNYIRTNKLLPLIATSEGYYVSYEEEEIRKQIKSLYERASAIMSSAIGLDEILTDNMLFSEIKLLNNNL